MNKSFYFQHDYNASSDAKILFLRQQLGMEGYGIFWFILEQLAQAGGSLPLKIIPVLAMQSQTQETKVNAVIHGYELFVVDGEIFYSNRLNDHFEIRRALSDQGKRGAERRWLKNGGAITGANSGANGHPNGGAYAKERKGDERIGEDNKGDESKEDETPTIQSIIKLLGWHAQDQRKRITARTLSIEAEKFLEKYKDEPLDSYNPRARKWVKNLYNDPII